MPEAGATVLDANGEPLVTTDPTARRRIVAAGTPELAVHPAAGRLVTDLDLDALLARGTTAPRARAATSSPRTSARRSTSARRRPATG